MKSPAKNNNHVVIVMITSTVRNSIGITLFKIIAIPDIPPVTRSKGMINTAAPNDRISVPAMTKKMFFRAVRISGLVNFVLILFLSLS
jgi:hypothetical protein